MTNFKFHRCSPKKPQNDRVHAPAEILWLFHFLARQCAGTQRSRDGWVSGSRDTWLHTSRVAYRADTINSFSSANRKSSSSKQGSVAPTDGAGRDEQACCHRLTAHFMTSPFHHGHHGITALHSPPFRSPPLLSVSRLTVSVQRDLWLGANDVCHSRSIRDKQRVCPAHCTRNRRPLLYYTDVELHKTFS